MKNILYVSSKNLLISLLLAITLFILSSTTSFAQSSVPVNFIKKNDELNAIIDKQREYIDLRLKGFDAISNIDSNLEKDIEEELSDLTTQLSSVADSLTKVSNDNYESIYSSAISKIKEINAKLLLMNTDHESKLIKDVTMSYLDPYKQNISNLYSLIELNKEYIDNKYIKSKIDEVDELISQLEQEYSEGNWVRMEEKCNDLIEALNTMASEIGS